MRHVRPFFLETGLVLAAALSPLFFGAVHPWASMSIAGLIFFLLCLNPDGIHAFFSISRISVFAAGILVCFVAFQIAFLSIQPYATIYQAVLWLAAAVGLSLILLLDRRGLLRWAYGLILAGVIYSLYGLQQVASGAEKILWQTKSEHLGFVTGPYFNRNHFAGYLEMCMGLQLGVLARAVIKKKVLQTLFWFLLLVINLMAFVKTGSRMGWASFASAFIILLPFFLIKAGKKGWVFVAILLVLAGAVAAINMETVFLRISHLGDDFQTFEGRLIAWQDSLNFLRAHLLFGSGLGTFPWGFPSYQSERLWMGWDHAHNDHLELMTEMGVPLYGVVVIFFLALWRRAFIFMKNVPVRYALLFWGAAISCLSITLHGFMDFNFAIPANAFLYTWLTGWTYRLACVCHSRWKIKS